MYTPVRSELCESPGEELANAISHGVGAVLSAIGLVVMTWIAVPLGAWHIIGVTVFGGSLVLLYLASTIYHIVTRDPWKCWLQVLDHALIFVLIAGSYT
ncbi:MAG: hemolysin III family protein, partial [Verrucomicrobiales bacterium]|nr:hemolysin III family protein [Verrucomicrobiales bacterium]